MTGHIYKAEEVIRLLRGQKHDLLNHLQVISGFLQLQRFDKALEYTRETIRTVTAQSTVLSLTCADLALCLMLEAQRAASHQAVVSLEVSPAGIPGGTTPLAAIGLVEEAWKVVTKALEQAPVGERSVRVQVLEKVDCCVIRFGTLLRREAVAGLDENLRQLNDLAGESGASCSTSLPDNGWELVIRFPKEDIVDREPPVGGV